MVAKKKHNLARNNEAESTSIPKSGFQRRQIMSSFLNKTLSFIALIITVPLVSVVFVTVISACLLVAIVIDGAMTITSNDRFASDYVLDWFGAVWDRAADKFDRFEPDG